MFKRLFGKWFSSESVSQRISTSESQIPTPEVVRGSPTRPTPPFPPKTDTVVNISETATIAPQAAPCECESTITETGEIDFCGLILEQTIEAHRSFIKELRDVLGGKMPEAYSPEIIGADNMCKLGKWLFNEGKSLEKYPAYAEVLEKHRAFHACAAEIVRLHQKQEFALAMKILNHDLKAFSEQVEVALLQLHEQAQAAKLANNGNLCA